MIVASIGENVSLSAFFYRNLPKEIRGTLIGITTALGTLGMFVFSTICGYLYDVVSHKTPFLLVGVCDFTFGCLILYLASKNKLHETLEEDIEEEEEICDGSRGSTSIEKYGAA